MFFQEHRTGKEAKQIADAKRLMDENYTIIMGRPPSRQHFYRAYVMGWHGGVMNLGNEYSDALDEITRLRVALKKIAMGDACADYTASQALAIEVDMRSL